MCLYVSKCTVLNGFAGAFLFHKAKHEGIAGTAQRNSRGSRKEQQGQHKGTAGAVAITLDTQ